MEKLTDLATLFYKCAPREVVELRPTVHNCPIPIADGQTLKHPRVIARNEATATHADKNQSGIAVRMQGVQPVAQRLLRYARKDGC